MRDGRTDVVVSGHATGGDFFFLCCMARGGKKGRRRAASPTPATASEEPPVKRQKMQEEPEYRGVRLLVFPSATQGGDVIGVDVIAQLDANLAVLSQCAATDFTTTIPRHTFSRVYELCAS